MTISRVAYDAAYRKAHRDKIRAYKAAYRKANPDKVLAYKVAYRKANSDKIRAYNLAYNAAYRKANSDKIKADAAKYYTEHQEQRKAYNAAYCKANPDKVKESLAAWKKANPEKIRTLTTRRRAIEAAAPGAGYTTAQHIRWRWETWGNKCWMCGGKATCTDHVFPLAKGGAHWPSNLRPACGPCNGSKYIRKPNLTQITPASVWKGRERG